MNDENYRKGSRNRERVLSPTNKRRACLGVVVVVLFFPCQLKGRMNRNNKVSRVQMMMTMTTKLMRQGMNTKELKRREATERKKRKGLTMFSVVDFSASNREYSVSFPFLADLF